MLLSLSGRHDSFGSVGHFFHQGQHLSDACADLASLFDGLLSEAFVFVVALALTSRRPAALGSSAQQFAGTLKRRAER